jgi:2-oxoglutarate/2-oxoacid ferredoxin oxidoreductase subunit beta
VTTIDRPTITSGGLAGVPLSLEPLTRKDFTSDQEVRWCPGCGDYAVLAAFQGFMPELGIKKENTVIVSGIGCSSRFPYYVDSFGMHSIHGRATAIATGVATARPDAAVFVITGDGDALSIGGNHLIHVLRRNVNLKILLFNNRIYGLTKGQYSPTSELGKVTKSTPMGSLDYPFNPVSLALGAEASFVGRTLDSDRKHLQSVLRAAADHPGSALVEIYQNCNIFNDGAFDVLKEPDTRDDFTIRMEHGQPLRFGADGSKAVVRDTTGALAIEDDVPADDPRVVVHDAHDENPAYAFALSRLQSIDARYAPMGVFRSVGRPVYDELMADQLEKAAAAAPSDGPALQKLLLGPDHWAVA